MAFPGESTILGLVRELYPEITTALVPDAWLTAWLPWATQIAGPAFASMRPLACALLLSHRALRSRAYAGAAAGASGPVTSVTTGALSQSWGTSAAVPARPSDADLLLTDAGRAYIELRDTIPDYVAPFVAL